MPDNGSGVYTLPPVYLGVAGQTIRAEQHNTPLQDLEAAQNRRLRRDGTTPMQASLPMNGNRVTDLGQATQPSDAVRLDQVTPYSPFIASIAGLTFAANEAPYATGPGVAGKMTVTAFGRDLIDSPNDIAARLTLGLQAGALAPAQLLAVWLAGTSPTNSIIAPAQLDATIKDKSLGWGQQWYDDTATWSAVNTPYQNTTGKPIQISVSGLATSTGHLISVSHNASAWVVMGTRNNVDQDTTTAAIIPPGHYWRRNLTVTGGTLNVVVLR